VFLAGQYMFFAAWGWIYLSTGSLKMGIILNLKTNCSMHQQRANILIKKTSL
jgi:hypothetical protein